MPKELHVKPNDVRGYGKLAVDATQRVTDLVEAIHQRIARPSMLFGQSKDERTTGITGLVYRGVREITGAIGFGIDQTLQPIIPLLEKAVAQTPSSPAREILLAVVNGVVGDHLEASDNPLALQMTFRYQDKPLSLNPEALSAAVPDARGHVLVVVHGLCMNDLQWTRDGYSHVDGVAQQLNASAVHLRYNSGRHISQNGREFAATLELLLASWPTKVTKLTLLTHSMGGLVTRSACHYGMQKEYRWLRVLKNVVFLGTPHHGAPLERHGNLFQRAVGVIPFAAPLARLGMLRSAGVTDLRYGALVDEDWNRRGRFDHAPDDRTIVTLPPGVRYFVAAATLGKTLGDNKDTLLGDGLVPVDSALGKHPESARCLYFSPSHQALFYQHSHWDLLYRREVGTQILQWLSNT
ncbi:esterase/lipase family protein [Stenotrophobium rhamnosiphilum]|uniref:Permease n=1 Tax=Stenotrophobium rhamnosiphilum TaxID=2029166 RepID=A0A2T5MFM0_9GAMM|nr:permease [Stenotrophobium rhamnosiphilum]PTU31366.1 permease [Stenotrophobium rhamnosiphilum]